MVVICFSKETVCGGGGVENLPKVSRLNRYIRIKTGDLKLRVISIPSWNTNIMFCPPQIVTSILMVVHYFTLL